MKTEVILRTFAQRVPEREALVCEGMRVTYEVRVLRLFPKKCTG
jgi:hypothetical protein